MDDIRNILVVSRDTKACRGAVHLGISLARRYEAKLAILHVIHNPFGAEGWNLPLVSLESDYKAVTREVKEELDRIVAAEKARGMPVRQIIKTGDPVKAVLSTIAEEKIDLAIMIAHEEGMIDHFLFGRANDEITRRMPCSILLVKKEEMVGVAA